MMNSWSGRDGQERHGLSVASFKVDALDPARCSIRVSDAPPLRMLQRRML